ncbi:unnamed protein product [Moneuplotes crassus]|uniref:U-box domain-containing protein n=1 Tax=Euplotes crassus TaxID=5936 RepID=A0AAD2D1C1_EUPCR|nr:unnamed protein product [Moneuplotes crassus]
MGFKSDLIGIAREISSPLMTALTEIIVSEMTGKPLNFEHLGIDLAKRCFVNLSFWMLQKTKKATKQSDGYTEEHKEELMIDCAPKHENSDDILKCPLSGSLIKSPVISPENNIYDEQSVKVYLEESKIIEENGKSLILSDFKPLTLKTMNKLRNSVSQMDQSGWSDLGHPPKKNIIKLVKHDYIPEVLKTATITRPEELIEEKYEEIPLGESLTEYVVISKIDEE